MNINFDLVLNLIKLITLIIVLTLVFFVVASTYVKWDWIQAWKKSKRDSEILEHEIEMYIKKRK